MRRTSLQGRKFYCSCLASTLCCKKVCQIRGCSLQLFMTKCIDIITGTSKLTHITTICKLDSFRNCNYNRSLFFKQLFYFFQKFFNIKRYFRQVNQIRSVTVFCFCQRCCSGQPACISSHDFHNGNHIFLVG